MLHSVFLNIYTRCTKCAVKPAYRPASIEEDPLCRDCLTAMVAEAADAAVNKAIEEARMSNPHSIIHPENAAEFEETVGQIARRMSGAEEYVREFNNDEGGCPGYEDSCSNTLKPGEELCAACRENQDEEDGLCPSCGEILDQDDTGLAQCPNHCENV